MRAKAADLASLIFPTGGLQSTHRWRHYLRAREALAYAVPQASEQLIIIKVQHLNQLRRSSDGWLIERHEHYGELSSHATMCSSGRIADDRI